MTAGTPVAIRPVYIESSWMPIRYQQSLASYLTSLGTITAEQYSDPADPGDRERIVPIP